MLTGYRGVILAFGLILTGAQQPAKEPQAGGSTKQKEAPAQPAPAPTEAAKPTYRAYTERYSDACYNTQDHDAADLCAQWRAAIAAEKAASEARLATIAAIIGTVLSLATVVGLIVTILQTHGALAEARRGNRLNLLFERRSRREARRSGEDQERALNIAERNAKAAERQVEVSQRTARLQLRAYLTAEEYVVTPLTLGSLFGIEFKIHNRGVTPASNVIAVTYVGTRTKPVQDNHFGGQPNAEDGASRSVIPAQGAIIISAGYSIATTQEMVDGFASGGMGFYCWGVVTYEDIFGDAHTTNFRIEVEPDLRVSHCPGGNDAD